MRTNRVGQPDPVVDRLAVDIDGDVPAQEVQLIGVVGGLLGAVAGVRGWEATQGGYRVAVDDPTAVAPELVRALVAAGADVVRVAEEEHSLEDVYLQVLEAAP